MFELRKRYLAILYFSWLAGSMPLPAESGKTPDTLYHPRTDYPIWISAKAAEQRSLGDPKSFHPLAAERIRNVLSQTPVAGCQQAGPIINDYVGGRDRPRSLEAAARSYPVFGYGIVREVTPGFQVGEAGHLLRVEISEPSRGFSHGQTYFVFVPVGSFFFHGKKICKEDIRYAGLPAVGDELLVFVDRPDPQEAVFFTIDYPEALVWVSGDKVTLAPRLAQSLSQGLGGEAILDRHALVSLLPRLEATPVEEDLEL